MNLNELHSFLLILTIAALGPFISEWIPRIRMPLVILEIALGVIFGPQVLNVASAGPAIQVFATFGLAFLFFLVGFEIDYQAIRGRPLALAGLGWLASLVLCLAAGFSLQGLGMVNSGLIVGAALSTTALGTLLPILRDSGELRTKFGAYTMASGAMGEFGPILLAVLTLSSGDDEHSGSVLLMLVFALIIVAGAYVAIKYRPPKIILLLQKKTHTSAQLPVRISILVLAALVILARNFGLDAVLGAIAAGVLVALASPGEYGEVLRHKLEAIAFGFFVPIFFVTTGLRYDLHALVSSKLALLQLPMFLALFFVVRGLPALMARRDLDLRSRLALGFFSSTQLPLVIVIIGVKANAVAPQTAASLIGAGMLSLLLFPVIGLALRRAREPATLHTATALDAELSHPSA